MASFTFHHRVRYQETDAQTFAFNSRYLEWVDVAMVEFFRSLGQTYGEMNDAGFDPSLLTTAMHCKRPARFDDVLDIDVDCTRVGSSSFELHYTVHRGTETLTEITTTYVNVDVATERSTPIPPPIARALRELVVPASVRE